MPYEFVPPQPWEIFLFSFWLLQHSFSWNYVKLSLQGEKKTFCAQTSAAPPAEHPIPPPTTLCPRLDTLSLSWVPQPPPSPNHGQQDETGHTQEHQVSHRAQVSEHPLPTACVTEETSASWAALCKFIFTNLANQRQGIQKYTLYMMVCIWHCLLSVKIPNWVSPGTCTVFLINIHNVITELLDAVWQENIVNPSAQLEKCIAMERKNCGQRCGIPVHC